MYSTHVVLLQSDPQMSEKLSTALGSTFHSIHIAQSVEDLRRSAAKHRPETLIVDLESASLGEVQQLKREFGGVRIICNHRVADEEMWTQTLTAGADDCLPSCDTRAILSSAVHYSEAATGVAA